MKRFSNKISLMFLSLFFLFLSACDRGRSGNGIVVDSDTMSPLSGVVAKSYGDHVNDDSYKNEMITDSSGRYTGSTGLPGAHKNLYIVLSKDQYHSVTVKNPFNDTTYQYK